MPTITYRKLDENGDPLFGNGQSNFVSDIDAVAQAIATRLKLLQGEWWEDLKQGTPLFQSMLGVAGSGKRATAIGQLLTRRILSTPYVTNVSSVSTNYIPDSRSFTYSCQVQTQFGVLTLTTEAPGRKATLDENQL